MTSSVVNQHGRSVHAMRAYSLNGGTTQYDEDVELVLNVASTSYSVYSPVPGQGYVNFNADLDIGIVNHSTQILNTVEVKLPYYNPFTCVSFEKLILKNFILQPGDTLHHSKPNQYIGFTNLAVPVLDTVHEICISILNPNMRVDRNPIDNFDCRTIVYNVIVSTDEIEFPVLQPYPNPSSSVFNFNTKNDLSTLTFLVVDPMGRVLLNQSGKELQGNRIDLSHTTDGIYFLRVLDELGRSRSFRLMKHGD